VTTREELITACRKAADLCSQLAYGHPLGATATGRLYEVANRCRYAVARAEAEDAADAPAAATDGESLFSHDIGEAGA